MKLNFKRCMERGKSRAPNQVSGKAAATAVGYRGDGQEALPTVSRTVAPYSGLV